MALESVGRWIKEDRSNSCPSSVCMGEQLSDSGWWIEDRPSMCPALVQHSPPVPALLSPPCIPPHWTDREGCPGSPGWETAPGEGRGGWCLSLTWRGRGGLVWHNDNSTNINYSTLCLTKYLQNPRGGRLKKRLNHNTAFLNWLAKTSNVKQYQRTEFRWCMAMNKNTDNYIRTLENYCLCVPFCPFCLSPFDLIHKSKVVS